MRTLVCAAVRSQIEAYHDGELAPGDRLIVSAHLEECAACRKLAEQLSTIAEQLRVRAAADEIDPPALRSLSSTVVARVQAEREVSLPVQVSRMFEDMHFVWAGLSASAATVACAALLFGIWFLSPPERADSLAGMLSALSSPVTTAAVTDRDLSMEDDWLVPAMLANGATEEDLVFALAALVTQDSRGGSPGTLSHRRDRDVVLRLMNAVSEARFQPASLGRNPGAVNLVWLTTVRGKLDSRT